MPNYVDPEENIHTVIVNVCERLKFVVESAYRMHQMGKFEELANEDAWWTNLDKLITQCGDISEDHKEMLETIMSYR